MTSASELFYTRRSRSSRNSLDQALGSSLDRTFHHHSLGNGSRRHQAHYHYINNNNDARRDHRHDVDGCDPLRRSLQIRHQPHRASVSERDTDRLDELSRQSSSGSIINLDSLGGVRNNHRFSGNDRLPAAVSGNDRLPGAVLLARERLLERLGGVSLSRNRRNRDLVDVNRSDLIVGDDFRFVDAGVSETDLFSEWLDGGPVTDSTPQTEQLLVPPQGTTKRPPGLTQEEINCLQLEVFSESKCSFKREMLRASQECSICLESFVEGDELMCLPCAHRFHSSCLIPWVRICGDCPYCRRGVVWN